MMERTPDVELHIDELVKEGVKHVDIWVLEWGEVPEGAHVITQTARGDHIAYRPRKENDNGIQNETAET